jgi:hypothetical protein
MSAPAAQRAERRFLPARLAETQAAQLQLPKTTERREMRLKRRRKQTDEMKMLLRMRKRGQGENGWRTRSERGQRAWAGAAGGKAALRLREI